MAVNLLIFKMLKIQLCLVVCFIQLFFTLSNLSEEKEFTYSNKYSSNHNLNTSKGTGNLPSIFIVGAQKGGSTSLYQLMVTHPLLCGGLQKETHFFDHSEKYDKGVEFYKQLYGNTNTNKKCSKSVKNTKVQYIDATPIIHLRDIWERISTIYENTTDSRGNLKFIVLLREPVARDYSWYQHTVRSGVFSLYKHI